MNKKLFIPIVLGSLLAVGGVLWAAASEATPRAPTADPQFGGENTELVSQFWGEFNAVEISGTFAYVCQGQRLSVFDISTLGNIRLVGQSEILTNEVLNLKVSGNYAFLADPGIEDGIGSRLHVVDISDPTAPFEATYFSTEGHITRDVALYNGFAFTASDDVLSVVDVHDPLSPSLVTSRYIPEDQARRIQVAYHAASSKVYAYLLASDFLIVVDVTDPAAPSRKASLEIGYYPLKGPALSEGRAYITDDDGKLHVIDISDPLHPLQVAETTFGVRFYNELEADGNILYAAEMIDSQPAGLRVLDASGPGLPVDLGFFPLPRYINDLDIPAGQGTVFLASRTDLVALDATNPSSPFAAGSYHQEGGIVNLVRSGNTLYLSRGYYEPESVEAYGFSNPTYPVKLGSLTVRGRVDSVVGDYLYMRRGVEFWKDPPTPSGLIVADVSDPAHMLVTDVFTTTTIELEDVSVYGNIAYLADGSAGLRLIDLSDPYNLKEISRYDPTDDIFSVSVATPANQPGKTYAYLGTSSGVLRVVDVTDPHAITERGSTDYASYEVYYNALYSPTLTTGTPPAAGYYVVALENENARLVDVSDPDLPVLVDDAWLQANARGITVQGDYVYVAADLKGVRILRYDGQTFRTKGYYRLPEQVFDVAVSGDFQQLAAGTNGLFNTWFGPYSYIVDMPTSGGVITSSFHNNTLTFPSGTFTATVNLNYQPRYQGNMPFQPGLTGIGVYYELDARTEKYNEEEDYYYFVDIFPVLPYQFELHYDEADLHGLSEATLGLYYWDGGQWVKEPSSSVDPTGNTLTAETMHTHLFAVLGEVKNVFLPLTQR